jgi:alcohol dehydrogenase
LLSCDESDISFTDIVFANLWKIGGIFKRHGYIDANLDALSAKELGRTVAAGILSFNRQIGFPTTLAEIEGIDSTVIEKILTAAKDPQLESKLQNIPVQLTADLVNQFMGPILEAAWNGDLGKIVIRE